jgi:hypothetical protein
MALPLLRVGKGCHPAAGRMDRLVRSGFDGAAAGRPYTGLERSRTWPLAEALIPRQFVSCHPWKGCVPLLLALVTSCTGHTEHSAAVRRLHLSDTALISIPDAVDGRYAMTAHRWLAADQDRTRS